jgi:hypothetical protein
VSEVRKGQTTTGSEWMGMADSSLQIDRRNERKGYGRNVKTSQQEGCGGQIGCLAVTSRLVSTDTIQEQSSARSLMPFYPPIASRGSVADQRAKEDDGGLGRKYARDKLGQVARGWVWPNKERRGT